MFYEVVTQVHIFLVIAKTASTSTKLVLARIIVILVLVLEVASRNVAFSGQNAITISYKCQLK